MNTFGITARALASLRQIFERHQSITEVWIFGSRAKGTARTGSDIDLAIMNEGVDNIEILRITSELEDSDIPYFVDVINFPKLEHLELRQHIMRVGQPLLVRSEGGMAITG